MNALELLQEFASTVGGITVGSYAVANQAEEVQQILSLLNQAGRELAKECEWQSMVREATFTTVATESQGTVLSITGATTVRKIIDDTIWNRTSTQQVWGPISPQRWQAQKAVVTSGPWPEFRIRGGLLLMNPVPPAGQSCYFEFISKSWVTDVTGVTIKEEVTVDTDLFLLDTDLLLMGLDWRYRRSKGLSFADERVDYENAVRRAMGDDKPREILRMSSEAQKYRAGIIVPIGDWPLP